MRKGMNVDQLKLNLLGEVTLNTKNPENQGFHLNFPATHKSYNSAVEFSIIG